MPAEQGGGLTPRASLPMGFLCSCSEGVTQTSGDTGAAAKTGRGKSVQWATPLRQGLHLPALLMQEPGEGDGRNNPPNPPFAFKLVNPTDHEMLHCQVPRELQNWGTTTVGRDLRAFQSNPANSSAELEWVALGLPLPRAKSLQLCRPPCFSGPCSSPHPAPVHLPGEPSSGFSPSPQLPAVVSPLHCLPFPAAQTHRSWPLPNTRNPTAGPELQRISGECWRLSVSILPSKGCHQG